VNLSWNIDSVNDIEAGTVGVVVSASGHNVLVKDLWTPAETRAAIAALTEKLNELSPPSNPLLHPPGQVVDQLLVDPESVVHDERPQSLHEVG
jgi:hypothetical protein